MYQAFRKITRHLECSGILGTLWKYYQNIDFELEFDPALGGTPISNLDSHDL